jgi:hypothetical protein
MGITIRKTLGGKPRQSSVPRDVDCGRHPPLEAPISHLATGLRPRPLCGGQRLRKLSGGNWMAWGPRVARYRVPDGRGPPPLSELLCPIQLGSRGRRKPPRSG